MKILTNSFNNLKVKASLTKNYINGFNTLDK